MAVEKIKILGLFWSYQLNSTANSAHFTKFLVKWAKLAPRILIFPLVLGAKYSFCVKYIATYALQKVDIIIHS